LIAVVRSLDGADLGRTVSVDRDTRIQHERMDRLLLHLYQHQVHAHAMMRETSVHPPQLDEFLSAGEVTLRADEFAALGWTEETVWTDLGATAGGYHHSSE
jgi:uncharacterized damage-inducible protein DinB